jgi:hypothetical protein
VPALAIWRLVRGAMPKLLVFLTAERVIIAQDQTASAITIFHGIDVGLTATPPDATPSTPLPLALSWVAFAAWQREEGDDGKNFEQRVAIKLPDGDILDIGVLVFSPAARVHRTLFSAPYFPLKGEGEYEVTLFIREQGSGHRWKKAGALPIEVRLVTQVNEGIAL